MNLPAAAFSPRRWQTSRVRRASAWASSINTSATSSRCFSRACGHSLELLDATLREAVPEGADAETSIRALVPALIAAARQHGNYNVLYNEITSGSCREFAPELAREIESADRAQLYTRLFETAKEAGALAPGLAPEAAAFFFDNLLMMLQFSYSCDYYQHRMRLYCGEPSAAQDAWMTEQLTHFILSVMKGDRPCNISLPTTSEPPA